MKIKFIYIFIILLTLILLNSKLIKINEYFIPNENLNNKIPKIYKKFISDKILKKIKSNEILKNFNNNKIKLLHYKNQNLNVFKYKNIKLKSFFNKNKYLNNKKNRYQTKIFLSSNKNLDIINFLNEVLSILIKNFKTFKPNILRISKKNWKFGEHFDCIDQILLQIEGKREIEISYNNKQIVFLLTPGDVLYLPRKIKHKINNTRGNFNINLNLNSLNYFKKNEMEKCSQDFEKIWPKQKKRCSLNNCI
jgi:hypothetical protein